MGTFSISDLEKLSGIKAHTIRIWEQRYHLLKPSRTDGNIRYYDDNELRRLLNISTLIKSGEKISKVSKLSVSQLNAKMDAIIFSKEPSNSYEEVIINQLIGAGLEYNEFLFEKAFSNAILKYTLVGAYQKVIYPMLVKVGLLWGKNDLIPSQEHFIINLVKQKLYNAIEQTPIPVKAKETWLLFLPEEEEHELGLLLSNFLLRAHGRRVVYLGQRVPYYNLKSVIEQVKPDFIQYFIVRNILPADLQQYINKMKTDFPKIKKCVCSSSSILSYIKPSSNTIPINSMDDLLNTLKNKKNK